MQASFDHIAGDYDQSFTNSLTGQCQRRMVWNYLDNKLSKNTLEVLEMNCGTGEDAIYIANKGHKVLATDISNSMIGVAKAKVEAKSLTKKVSLRPLGFQDITFDRLQKKFDVVFSNFGGLNCVNPMTINEVALNLSKVIKPGGSLIGVIMPDACLWERVYFMAKFKFKSAFRRSSGKAMAHVDGKFVETWYYNPKVFRELMGDKYSMIKVKPIGFALPPSYLESYFKNKKFLLNGLLFLEKVFNKFPFLSKFSDHYLIELQLKK